MKLDFFPTRKCFADRISFRLCKWERQWSVVYIPPTIRTLPMAPCFCPRIIRILQNWTATATTVSFFCCCTTIMATAATCIDLVLIEMMLNTVKSKIIFPCIKTMLWGTIRQTLLLLYYVLKFGLSMIYVVNSVSVFVNLCKSAPVEVS